MSTQIIADSTCDIEEGLLEGLELKVLPLVITIEGREYFDSETINVSELYETMSRGIVPKTAQIPYDRTYDLFRSCLDSGRDVIYISFSSTMSNCFSLACMAAKELSAVYPDRKIAVIDSKGGSGATGLIVLQARKWPELARRLNRSRAPSDLCGAHRATSFRRGLDGFAKGGRIPRIVGRREQAGYPSGA